MQHLESKSQDECPEVLRGMWQTIGHTHITRVLDSQIRENLFSHAYIFTGPKGVGKASLANEFARKIRGTESASFDPDITSVDVTTEFGVEEIRRLLSSLSVKPFSGKYKIIILNDADTLNTQSANALLKTLEEPGSSTIIILVAHSKTLPSTIWSRCQTYTFGTLTEEEIAGFLAKQDFSASPELIALSRNIPGRLWELGTNPELQSRFIDLEKKLQTLTNQTPGERMAHIQEFADLDPLEFQECLTIWLTFARQKVSSNVAEGLRQLTALAESRGHAQTSINKKLILERLFLAL